MKWYSANNVIITDRRSYDEILKQENHDVNMKKGDGIYGENNC